MYAYGTQLTQDKRQWLVVVVHGLSLLCIQTLYVQGKHENHEPAISGIAHKSAPQGG